MDILINFQYKLRRGRLTTPMINTEMMPNNDRTDRALEVLSDNQCREILVLLSEESIGDPELSLETIVERCENASVSEASLYHHHIPKLVEARIIEWDDETMTVQHGEAFDVITDLLEFIDDRELASE